jgi:signal transduction histidine kinase
MTVFDFGAFKILFIGMDGATPTLSEPLATLVQEHPTIQLAVHQEDAPEEEFDVLLLWESEAIQQIEPATVVQGLQLKFPNTPLIVLAAGISVARAVAWMRAGATEVVEEERFGELQSLITRSASSQRPEVHPSASRIPADRLLRLITTIRNSLNLEVIFNTAVSEVRAYLAADRVVIYQFDPRFDGTIVAESVGEGWAPALHQQIIDTCFRQTRASQYTRERVIAIANVDEAQLAPCYHELLKRFEVHANLVAPIFLHDQVWGLLIAHQCSGSRSWPDEEISLFSQITVQLSVAIAHAQWVVTNREQQARRERELFFGLSESIRSAIDPQQAFVNAVQEVRSFLNVDRATLFHFSEDWSGQFVAESVAEHWTPLITPQEHLPQGESGMRGFDDAAICDTYLQEDQGGVFREPTTYKAVADIYQAGLSECHIELLEHFQARAYLIVPVFEHRSLWGLLAVYQNSGPRTWKESEINLLIQVAGQLDVPLQQARLFEASRAQVAELERLAELKNEFLSTVSHELRTPLTSIHGALGLLASGTLGTLSAKAQRMIDIALSNTDRLVRLINDLLDIERMESGRIALACQVVDLARLAKQAADVMNSLSEQAGVQLILECQSVEIFADPDRIVQTVTNLLSNAIKFSSQGTSVWLSVTLLGDKACLEVKDEGRGISTANLEMIFERFHQVDASDSRHLSGTGLGLAICRSIVQQHGGRIWAESTLGEGSTFSITFPLASLQQSEGQLVLSDHRDLESWAKILLIEDNTELAQILTAMFAPHNVAVCHAKTGDEALQLCESSSFDLLVLDIVLPNMNGFEVVNHLRQNDVLRSKPLVIYSVQDLREEEKEDLRLGSTLFFSKSRVSPAAFEAQVLDLLNRVLRARP